MADLTSYAFKTQFIIDLQQIQLQKKTVRNYIHISHFQETHIYIQISLSRYLSFEDPQFLMLCNEQELTYYDELMV